MKTKLLLASLLLCCLGLLAATAPEKYLKLTGGTMTGPIYFGSPSVFVGLGSEDGLQAGFINELPGGRIGFAITGNNLNLTPQGFQFVVNGAQGFPVYPNNAAALAGGLTVGYLYRTGGDPDVLAIVH